MTDFCGYPNILSVLFNKVMLTESFSLPTLFQWANKTIGHSKNSNNNNNNSNNSLVENRQQNSLENINSPREKKLKKSHNNNKNTSSSPSSPSVSSPSSSSIISSFSLPSPTYYLERMIVDSPTFASSSSELNYDPLDLNEDDSHLSPLSMKMIFEPQLQNDQFSQELFQQQAQQYLQQQHILQQQQQQQHSPQIKSIKSPSPFCFLKSNSKKSISKRFGRKYISIEDLPTEVIIHILSYLNPRDIGYVLPLVNRNFKDFCNVFVLWKSLYMKHWSKKSSNRFFNFQNVYGYQPLTNNSNNSNSNNFDKYFSKKPNLNKNYKKMYQTRHIVEKNWKKGVCSVQTLYGHQEGVWGVQFHGDTLVSGAEDGVMKIWDTKEGECTNTLIGHTDVINSFHFEGERVVSGSDDSTLKMWRTSDGQCINTFNGHVGSVWMLEFKDNFLVSGGDDRSVRLWDMNTGQQIQSHTGHTGRIYYVQMGDNMIVSGAQDKTCRVWDVRTGKSSHTMVSNSPVHCLQMNGDLLSGGEWSVASGHNNGTISVWNMRSGSLQAVLSSPLCCPVWHIQFRQNIIYTSSCNNLHAWNLNLSLPNTTNNNTNNTVINNNNTQSNQGQLTCSKIFKGHTKSIKHFQVKENRMVSGGMDNKIKVWDLEKPGSSYLYTLAGHTGSVDWLEFKKDKLISCSADHTIRVWSFLD